MAASTKAKPPTSRSPITITAIFSTRTWRGVNTVPGNGVLSGSLAAAIVLRPHVDRTQHKSARAPHRRGRSEPRRAASRPIPLDAPAELESDPRADLDQGRSRELKRRDHRGRHL